MFRWHTALPCPGMTAHEASGEKRAGKVHKNRKGKQPMSLASKITTSAAMLAREAAGGSSAGEISELLSNAANMRGKASNGPSVDSSRWMEELPVRATSLYGPPGSSHASFRSSPTEELPNPEFETFINSSTSLLHILPDEGGAYQRLPLPKVNSSGILDQFSALSSDAHNMDSEHFDSGLDFHQVAPSSEAITILDIPAHITTNTHLSTTEPEQLDRLALTRLRLIAGHLAQTSSSSIQFCASTQDVLGQEARSMFHVDQRFSHIRSEFVQDITRNTQGPAQMSAQFQTPTQRQYDQSPRQHSSSHEHEDEEERTASDFHCPWIRCHQRFQNPGELQRHSNTHTEYACPHEDCPVLCQSRAAWANHIVEPHHDLLESPFRTLSSSEAEVVDAAVE
ncbi:hypothetical protein P154DRAFT_562847 [Amniculicola lignicola CBS 123094]|uniref:C2H2-type domain-containing protein n=1 Tax=Amniculicola lignicola CBS 123094 TaxID=1392246 RepID=A0A6A5WHV8_9PLEO|nr:hypothetical protein P154DRAFT_562847 [Amniculicola lignicola CBS 123094]